MDKFVVTSLRQGAGKTSVIIGITKALNRKIGYIKPFGERFLYRKKRLWDYDAALITNIFGLEENPENMSIGFHHSKLLYMLDEKTTREKLRELLVSVGEGKEIFFAECGKDITYGVSVHLDALTIARDLNAKLIVVASGDEDTILDDVVFFKKHIQMGDVHCKGIIINKVANVADFCDTRLPKIQQHGVEVLGVIPYYKELPFFSVGYLADRLFAKIISGEENLNRTVKNIFIGSMSACNYETCNNTDIYGYNISSGKEFPICTSHGNQWSPAIAGNIVVWQDYRNASSNFKTYFDIYGYNISSGKEFPICTEDGAQERPDISGNIVVWLDGRKGNIIDTYGYGNDIYDIYGYNISSGTEFPVCINPSAQYCPSISGNIVVWEDYRNGYFNPDIYGYDISSGKEFPICTANGTQELPDISGNIVVWQDNRNGKTAVYGYDLSNGEEFPICTNPAEQYSPHISGNYVVWIDGRNGSSIYGTRLTFDNK